MSFDISDLKPTPEQLHALWERRASPEKMSSDHLLEKIDRHFDIEAEVPCKHFSSERRKRIDFVIRPKNRSRWKRQDLVFGVEVKKKERDSLGEFTRHFGQSVDYANSIFDLTNYGDRFDGFIGPLPILTFPSFIPGDVPQILTATLRRMASSVGVGEIGYFFNEPRSHPEQSPIENGFGIVWQGHPLWWLHSGTTKEGYTWPINRRFGAR